MMGENDSLAAELHDLFEADATSRIDDGARAERLGDAVVMACDTPAVERDAWQDFVVASFHDEASPRPRDAARIARLVQRTAPGTSLPSRRRARRWLQTSPALAILLVSSGVLAAGVVATAVVGPAWAPSVRSAEPATAQEAVSPPRAARAAVPKQAPPAVVPAAVTFETSARLFARANQLRRQGLMVAAQRSYDQLVTRYPRAHESALARLTLADLLSARGRHDAAVAQLDAYLRAHDRALAEDALQRKARALEALGRPAAALAAWGALLARNPLSVYRSEAELRLAPGARP